MQSQDVVIDYTNWRGRRRDRRIRPVRVWFGSTDWHKEDQWLLEAVDAENGLTKLFAMKDIHEWKPVP